MRIAICDDEKNAQERLTEMINDWASDRNTDVEFMYYGSAEEFIITWPDVPCDLVFLDIKMKKISGIELAAQIRKTDKNILIVFITSYQQYGLLGYNVDALNYLIKPVSPAKLLPTLDKAFMIYKARKNNFIIAVKENNQFKVFVDDIFYISMSAHYAEIRIEKETYTIRKSVKEFSEILPEYFIQCHRSHIVNLFKVDCIYKDSLVLSNGKKLPLSRSNIKQVKDAFMNFQTR